MAQPGRPEGSGTCSRNAVCRLIARPPESIGGGSVDVSAWLQSPFRFFGMNEPIVRTFGEEEMHEQILLPTTQKKYFYWLLFG